MNFAFQKRVDLFSWYINLSTRSVSCSSFHSNLKPRITFSPSLGT